MFRIKSTVGIAPVVRHCRVLGVENIFISVARYCLISILRAHNFIHFLLQALISARRDESENQTGPDETEQMSESVKNQ